MNELPKEIIIKIFGYIHRTDLSKTKIYMVSKSLLVIYKHYMLNYVISDLLQSHKTSLRTINTIIDGITMYDSIPIYEGDYKCTLCKIHDSHTQDLRLCDICGQERVCHYCDGFICKCGNITICMECSCNDFPSNKYVTIDGIKKEFYMCTGSHRAVPISCKNCRTSCKICDKILCNKCLWNNVYCYSCHLEIKFIKLC